MVDNLRECWKFPRQFNQNVCHFWNETVNTSIPRVLGQWSREGCFTTSIEDEIVKCECNHLTNFALILDTSQSGENLLELKIVTWIGCLLSIGSLLLTLLTLFLFRKTLVAPKLPNKILIGLSVSLLCTIITFLVGVEKTEDTINCKVVAGLIQYFLLTTFCWMVVESVNLYRMFVNPVPNINTNQKQFMLLATASATGLPLLVTGITAIIEPENYGSTKDYQL